LRTSKNSSTVRTDKIRLYLKIMKLKGKVFYMRYVKIIVLAIMEVIAELYLRRDKES
jgi:hypothetical protein